MTAQHNSEMYYSREEHNHEIKRITERNGRCYESER